MGLLDDAIREHLDLKRRRGADASEIAKEEADALGPVRRDAGDEGPIEDAAPAEHGSYADHEPAGLDERRSPTTTSPSSTTTSRLPTTSRWSTTTSLSPPSRRPPTIARTPSLRRRARPRRTAIRSLISPRASSPRPSSTRLWGRRTTRRCRPRPRPRRRTTRKKTSSRRPRTSCRRRRSTTASGSSRSPPRTSTSDALSRSGVHTGECSVQLRDGAVDTLFDTGSTSASGNNPGVLAPPVTEGEGLRGRAVRPSATARPRPFISLSSHERRGSATGAPASFHKPFVPRAPRLGHWRARVLS